MPRSPWRRPACVRDGAVARCVVKSCARGRGLQRVGWPAREARRLPTQSFFSQNISMSLRRYCLLALLTASASAVAPAVCSASAATLNKADANAALSGNGSAAAAVSGDDDAGGPAYGPELQGFDYPAPVERFEFTSQSVPLQMAYMDVKPAHANGRTAVLLHGKNFCAATWGAPIHRLSDAGYRVIAPDQIGFCKSTKPEHYQYSFQQLARNTHALLASLGINGATMIGHSTGGMLAIRYALMYPRETQQLVLVNPIGLEDWKAKGVPSLSVDQGYDRESKTGAAGIRRYEQATYYAGQWRADYEPWVQMLAGMYRGPGK